MLLTTKNATKKQQKLFLILVRSCAFNNKSPAVSNKPFDFPTRSVARFKTLCGKAVCILSKPCSNNLTVCDVYSVKLSEKKYWKYKKLVWPKKKDF